MKKITVLIIVTTFIFAGFLSGCTEKSNEKLILGKWNATNGWAQFFEDGRYIRYNDTQVIFIQGSWEILNDNILIISTEYLGIIYLLTYQIEVIDDNTISLTDETGETRIQTRIS